MCTTCGCNGNELRIEGRLVESEATDSVTRTAEQGIYRHAPRASSGFIARSLATHAPAAGIARSLDAVHAAGVAQLRTVQVERAILAKNDALARDNRRLLARRGVFAVNMMSSPGSGKTSLLVRTIRAWGRRTPIVVIEGDQQTSRDAERIRATGAHAIQINTGKGCHLDADMIARALHDLALADGTLLLIENVGNLVCPAAFDLGEARRVVVLSVTEGEDKPLKYPDMFHAADLVLVNKIDLLPYVSFDMAAALDYARRVQPRLPAMPVSAQTGEGFDAWLAWLARGVDAMRALHIPEVAGKTLVEPLPVAALDI